MELGRPGTVVGRRAFELAAAVDDAIAHYERISPPNGGLLEDFDVVAARAFVNTAPRFGLRAVPVACGFLAFNGPWAVAHAAHGTMPDEATADGWYERGGRIYGCGWGQEYVENPLDGFKTWQWHLGVEVGEQALYLPRLAAYGAEEDPLMPALGAYRVSEYVEGPTEYPGCATPLPGDGRLVIYRHRGCLAYEQLAAWNDAAMVARVADRAALQMDRLRFLAGSMNDSGRLYL